MTRVCCIYSSVVKKAKNSVIEIDFSIILRDFSRFKQLFLLRKKDKIVIIVTSSLQLN